MSGRDDEILATQENQPDGEIYPQFPIYEHKVSPLVSQLLGIIRVILHQLRILRLLEIGGVLQWVKLVKVLLSGEVSVEEILDDIFKSKRKYSCALLWR